MTTVAAMWNCIPFGTEQDRVYARMSPVHEGFYVVFIDKFPVAVCDTSSGLWLWDKNFNYPAPKGVQVRKAGPQEVFDVYRRGVPALAALIVTGAI